MNRWFPHMRGSVQRSDSISRLQLRNGPVDDRQRSAVLSGTESPSYRRDRDRGDMRTAPILLTGPSHEHNEVVPQSQLVRLSALLFLFLWMLPFLLTAQAHGTEYFCDCMHGSDSADGHSPHSAWEHLAAVHAFSEEHGFLPGDKILLKRGCRWREELKLQDRGVSAIGHNSGTQEKPLEISAFGTGELPTLDGADEVSHWVSQTGGVYAARVDGPIYKVYVDGETREAQALLCEPNFVGSWQPHTEYRIWDYVVYQGKTLGALQDIAPTERFVSSGWYHAPDLPPEKQISGKANVARIPGSWFFESRSHLLYVHLADGSDPSRHSIEISRRRHGIELDGVSHTIIEGLRIVHAAKAGILAHVYMAGPRSPALGNEFNTIENTVIWNSADISTEALPASGLHVEGAIVIAASTNPNDRPLRGWVIQNNAIGMIDSALVSAFDRSGITAIGTDSLLLKNNYIAAQNAMGASVYTERGPRCIDPHVESNWFTANQGNLRVSGCTNPIVDSNTFAYSYGYGIQTGGNSSGAVITHNLIHHLTLTPNAHSFNGVDCNGGAPAGTVAYNTIEAVWAANITLELGCDHSSVHDNVLDSSNNAQHGGLTLYLRREALQGTSFRHNVYRVDPHVARQFNVGAGTPGAKTFHDFAWWRLNMEPTAVLSEEPLFASHSDGDYALRSAAKFSVDAWAALPVQPFAPTEASKTYLREALKQPWIPQDALH
jgi:Right handed beta helix region